MGELIGAFITIIVVFTIILLGGFMWGAGFGVDMMREDAIEAGVC